VALTALRAVMLITSGSGVLAEAPQTSRKSMLPCRSHQAEPAVVDNDVERDYGPALTLTQELMAPRVQSFTPSPGQELPVGPCPGRR